MASHTTLPRATLLLPLLKRSWTTKRRSFLTTTLSRSDAKTSSFTNAPAPPKLPKGEQEVFEELQRQSTGAFSARKASPEVNQPPDLGPSSSGTEPSPSRHQAIRPSHDQDSDELHPDVRLGAEPEFEGIKNPKTGEIGGPKNEPLRWGSNGDWSYNGRVTDF